MSGSLTTLIVLGVAIVGFMNRCEWFQICGNIGDIFKGGGQPSGGAAAPAEAAPAAEGEAGEYDAKTGEYKAPKGGYKNTGGYKGTPGWYTASGHHHCNIGEKDCVCTDPKKCLGIRGTGSEACKGGKCAPGPGQCRPDLGRYGATPCGDCPPGTGGGKCAGGTYKAKYGNAYVTYANSRYVISNEFDHEEPNISNDYVSDDVIGRYIDPGVSVRCNELKYNPFDPADRYARYY